VQKLLEGFKFCFEVKVIDLIDNNKSSDNYFFQKMEEDTLDVEFQYLFQEHFPNGKENFDIRLKRRVSKSNIVDYKFSITPYFPLNMVLSSQSLGGYSYISAHLLKIQKVLWLIRTLSMKGNIIALIHYTHLVLHIY